MRMESRLTIDCRRSVEGHNEYTVGRSSIYLASEESRVLDTMPAQDTRASKTQVEEMLNIST
jgi:hypothetical protein